MMNIWLPLIGGLLTIQASGWATSAFDMSCFSLSHPAHPDIIIDFRLEGGNLNLYIQPQPFTSLFHIISPTQNQYLQCKLAQDNCCLLLLCLLCIHISTLIRYSISSQIRFVLNLHKVNISVQSVIFSIFFKQQSNILMS